MKLICRFVERRLALLAVRGDDLGGEDRLPSHVRRCASCRSAWEGLRRLHEGLSQEVHDLEIGCDFSRAVSERIAAAEVRPPSRLLLAGRAFAIPVGIAVLLFAFRLYYAKPGAERPVVSHHPSMVAGAGEPTAVAVRDESSHPKGAKQAPKQRPQARRHRRKRAKQRTVPVIGRTLVADNGKGKAEKVPWATVGLYYEYAGDYRRASAAYAMAYKQKADPQLAYAVARSAEGAGDVTSALDYYATLLDKSPEQKR